MLKGKKTARGRDGSGLFKMRLAGRAALLTCLLLLAADYALAKSFASNSARDGGTEMYNENNSFGTNRGSGSSFTTDPETGDRGFETRPMPEKEQPEQIEIMPVYPEVRPQAPTPKPPIIVDPGV